LVPVSGSYQTFMEKAPLQDVQRPACGGRK
jgi:hypothetical protein